MTLYFQKIILFNSFSQPLFFVQSGAVGFSIIRQNHKQLGQSLEPNSEEMVNKGPFGSIGQSHKILE
jgi:hypothetical protein